MMKAQIRGTRNHHSKRDRDHAKALRKLEKAVNREERQATQKRGN